MSKLSIWIEELIADALPEEFSKPSQADYRTVVGGRGTKFDDWHADGSSINATLALKGAGTEIMPKGSRGLPVTSEQGELFIFTGSFRRGAPGVPPTIHRSPPGEMDRFLFLMRID